MSSGGSGISVVDDGGGGSRGMGGSGRAVALAVAAAGAVAAVNGAVVITKLRKMKLLFSLVHPK